MSSQLFFRDKGKFWRYNGVTKGADSKPSSMGLLILEANGAIRHMRLAKTRTAKVMNCVSSNREPLPYKQV